MAMREQIGLSAEEPLKWNYSQNSAVRRRVEEHGWTNRERRRVMIETIRNAPITLLADVIYDDREARRPPLDFYKEALDWVVLRFRNFVTDLAPAPPGPHVVVLDQPSPAPPARPTDDPRFSWLANREHIWYVQYRSAYENGWRFSDARTVRPARDDGFYPSVVISHAKFNPLLEVADAIAGISLDFAHYNLGRAQGNELPEIEWRDEQFIKVASKFRANPQNGNILNWGFALFPSRAPAFDSFAGWVTTLCTHPNFAFLRDG
jgi:hypothetical protein